MTDTADTALATRAGLPEHLRVLADLYPRADWQGHANFSDLTAFWLDRHIMFRDLSSRLITASEGFLDRTADPARYGPEVSRIGGFLLNQLHGHHNIEDHHYFPQLIGLDARVDPAFELLDSDHHALDAHIQAFADGCNAVIGALQSGGDARKAAGDLLDQQRRFDGFLLRHLEDEEEIIVPVILEYAPPIG